MYKQQSQLDSLMSPRLPASSACRCKPSMTNHSLNQELSVLWVDRSYYWLPQLNSEGNENMQQAPNGKGGRQEHQYSSGLWWWLQWKQWWQIGWKWGARWYRQWWWQLQRAWKEKEVTVYCSWAIQLSHWTQQLLCPTTKEEKQKQPEMNVRSCVMSRQSAGSTQNWHCSAALLLDIWLALDDRTQQRWPPDQWYKDPWTTEGVFWEWYVIQHSLSQCIWQRIPQTFGSAKAWSAVSAAARCEQAIHWWEGASDWLNCCCTIW